MTREHLEKILYEIFPHKLYKEAIDRLYAPEYFIQEMDEDEFLLIKRALTFNHSEHGLTFKSGRISCSVVEFLFSHSRFEQVRVNVFYDFIKSAIYNTVLALPQYTQKDWAGGNRISQQANTVRNGKELERCFNRLYKRFECPDLCKN